MNGWSICKRELASYFTTPIAYVFIIIFLMLSSVFTFYLGNFFARGSADLLPFFNFHPWLYLFFIPALTMRIWSEERKTGSIELLLTLPVSLGSVVIGKFVAAWLFTGFALLLTFPMWLTVNYLGSPDNGVILASYLGSFFLAGAYLAIGCCFSALTKNQVIAFILTVALCLGFLLSGITMVTDFFAVWAPQIIVDAVSSFSFLNHFNAIAKGVIDFRDIIFFSSVVTLFLFLNALVIELKKAD